MSVLFVEGPHQNPGMSRLTFIRHAQASYGSDNYDQLSPTGWKQANILGEYLARRHPVFTKIYLGPLRRHRETFSCLESAYQRYAIPLPEVVVLPELIEHRGPAVMRHVLPLLLEEEPTWAQWMRESADDHALRRKYHLRLFDEVMRRWAAGTLDRLEAPYQNWAEFRAHVARAMQQILAENPEPGHRIGVFSSGGTMSAAAGFALGMEDPVKIIELNSRVFNTSFSKFLFSGERISLQSFNEVPHLEETLWTLV